MTIDASRRPNVLRTEGVRVSRLHAKFVTTPILRALYAAVVVATACVPGCSAGCDYSPVSRGASGAAPDAARLIVAPDDGTTEILDAVRGARRRVLVEMYMLTAPDAVSALIDARARDIDVRVLLEPMPYGDAAANQAAFATLAAAHVDVRWLRRATGLVHAKMILVDGSIAYVMTLNLTSAGLATNREYAIVDGYPPDVRWAEAIWNADAIGAEPGPVPDGTRLLVSPLDARRRLAATVDSAATSIALEIEELSDGDLVGRLTAAQGRGVNVSVVVPALNRSAATNAALGRLSAAGIGVGLLAAPTVHAKAMVVDVRRAYVGSMNFTRASLDDNREFGVLLNSPMIARTLSVRIASDAAAAATSE